MKERKAFNFFRSYYDVFCELEKDKDKLQFITALLDRQFKGKSPDNLTGMAKFAYISQQFNIDSQVDGFESKTGVKLSDNDTYNHPIGGGSVGAMEQEKEKEKEKEYNNIPPEKINVKDYCAAMDYKIDVDRFMDFYSSKGWMVGKSKMKDWKAAVRNWNRNSKPQEKKYSGNEINPITGNPKMVY